MSQHANILRIKAIAGLLDQINQNIVFVGGATVSLYADIKSVEVRPTDDVDVIIELASALDEYKIKIFSLPYFIASKLEAFKNRGKGNYRFSSDFEDIVFVLENNSQALNLILKTNKNLLNYLQSTFSAMLKDANFEEGLIAHLEPATAYQQYVKIKTILSAIVGV